MSFQFDRGLFKFDFNDRHAILGVPIDAKPQEIRRRYLGIARRLHPDTCPASDKQQAEAFFSKLVSPAWKKLQSDRDLEEYSVLLRMMGQRLLQEKDRISLRGEPAKQLVRADNYEKAYRTLLENLAQQQYESLDKTEEIISQISELNLIYLLRKQQKGKSKRATTPPPPPKVSSKPAEPQRDSYVVQCCHRAEDLLKKRSYDLAKQEIQDALKRSPNDSLCHALMSQVYLYKNQLTVARVHLKKSLQSNPKEEKALEVKKQLERLAVQNSKKKTSSSKSSSKSSQSNKSSKSGGGLFGLFGGGKKK